MGFFVARARHEGSFAQKSLICAANELEPPVLRWLEKPGAFGKADRSGRIGLAEKFGDGCGTRLVAMRAPRRGVLIGGEHAAQH